MPTVHFTQNLARHLPVPSMSVDGDTAAAALEKVFERTPAMRSYVLDDQGAVRKHVTIFIDGEPLHDRAKQSDAVRPTAEVFVTQALSGG